MGSKVRPLQWQSANQRLITKATLITKPGAKTLTCLCWMLHRCPEKNKTREWKPDQKAGTVQEKEREKRERLLCSHSTTEKQTETQTSAQLIPESQTDVLINAGRLQITPSLPLGLKPSEMERTKGGGEGKIVGNETCSIKGGRKWERVSEKEEYLQLQPHQISFGSKWCTRNPWEPCCNYCLFDRNRSILLLMFPLFPFSFAIYTVLYLFIFFRHSNSYL